MKRNFTAAAAALALCVIMLFGGCREGGYELSSGHSAEESTEELNVGELIEFSTFSSAHTSVFSSSIVPSGSAEGNRSSTVSSGEPSSVPPSTSSSISSSVSTSVSSSKTSSGFDSSMAEIASSRSSFSDSSDKSSGSVPIVTVVPEEPPVSTSTVDDVPNDDIPADPNEGSSSSEESSASLPEPSKPETSVSPYDYEGTVYVAASGKGTKYHKNPNCSNMKGVSGMNVQDALIKGYTPCKKCW